MDPGDTQEVAFDPDGGEPLEAWLNGLRTQGWRPVPGSRTLVRTPSGPRLVLLMQRIAASGQDAV